jgi:hypothetical protein
MAGTFGPDAYFLNLVLNDPATALAFVDRYNANTSPSAPVVVSWQAIRAGDALALAKVRQILMTGSWLLAFWRSRVWPCWLAVARSIRDAGSAW